MKAENNPNAPINNQINLKALAVKGIPKNDLVKVMIYIISIIRFKKITGLTTKSVTEQTKSLLGELKWSPEVNNKKLVSYGGLEYEEKLNLLK